MPERPLVRLPCAAALRVESAGLFVGPPRERHPERTLASYELIVCRGGRLALEEDGEDVSVAAGQALLLRPGRRHRGTAPYGPGLSFWWLHFHVAGRSGRGDLLDLPRRTTPARPERLGELFHRLIDDRESALLTPPMAAACLQLMLCELRMARAERADASPAAATLLAARAEAYIDEHFARGLGATQVARALGVNADHLTRACRAARRMTITACIRRRVLREARSLLRDTTLSAKEIARACGFADAGYLRTLFRRHEGMSPIAYRRLHARSHINRR